MYDVYKQTFVPHKTEEHHQETLFCLQQNIISDDGLQVLGSETLINIIQQELCFKRIARKTENFYQLLVLRQI